MITQLPVLVTYWVCLLFLNTSLSVPPPMGDRFLMAVGLMVAKDPAASGFYRTAQNADAV